jgi:hypothetical protein
MGNPVKRDTDPGAVDDNATQRVRDRKSEQNRQLDAAWNTGRNAADPARKKKGRIIHDD